MKNNGWKIVIGINILLGLMLWFGYLTDYSWASSSLDASFPLYVGGIALLSMIYFVNRKDNLGKWRKVKALLCLPSLTGCCLSTLFITLMIMPPFTLGFFFMMAEMDDEVLIQQATSPDGSRVAKVYFRPVGAYGAGNGRTYVRVEQPLLPFVERDVFSLTKSYADENTSNYLSWVDNDTLLISETDEKIELGMVRLSISSTVTFPIRWACYILALLTPTGDR